MTTDQEIEFKEYEQIIVFFNAEQEEKEIFRLVESLNELVKEQCD